MQTTDSVPLTAASPVPLPPERLSRGYRGASLRVGLFVHWYRVAPWGLWACLFLILLRPEPALYWVESWPHPELREPVRAVLWDWATSPVGQWAMRLERGLRTRMGLSNESIPVSIAPPHADAPSDAPEDREPAPVANISTENKGANNSINKSVRACFNQPKRVLLVGDSMMQGLVPSLTRQLKPLGAQVLDHSKHSTGLVSKAYYNWPEKLAALLAQHTPDMVMVMLGTNDHLDMVEGKQYIRYRSEAWHARYTERVQHMAGDVVNQGAALVWIGLPAMREPWYEDAAKVTTAIFSREVTALGMPFIDARPVLLEPSETYSHYLSQGEHKVLARASDGIHLAPHGNQRLVKAIFERLPWCPSVPAPVPSTADAPAAPAPPVVSLSLPRVNIP